MSTPSDPESTVPTGQGPAEYGLAQGAAPAKPSGREKRQSSLGKRLRRWAWNAMAVVGIVSLVSMTFGLTYGYFVYRDASPSQLSSGSNPLPESLGGEGELADTSNIGLTLPPEFVEARLGPIPPLQQASLVFAALSVANPVEKVMVFANPTRADLDNYYTGVEKWLEDSPDYDYACEVGDKARWYEKTEVMGGKLNQLMVCNRTLNDNEKRIAQAERGYTSFYAFERDNRLIFMQFMVGGNSEQEAALRTRSLLKGFAWS